MAQIFRTADDYFFFIAIFVGVYWIISSWRKVKRGEVYSFKKDFLDFWTFRRWRRENPNEGGVSFVWPVLWVLIGIGGIMLENGYL